MSRMRYLFATIATIFAVAGSHLPASAADVVVAVPAGTTITGARHIGAATVHYIAFNPVKYIAAINSTITEKAGPDLSKFSGTQPNPGASAAPAGTNLRALQLGNKCDALLGSVDNCLSWLESSLGDVNMSLQILSSKIDSVAQTRAGKGAGDWDKNCSQFTTRSGSWTMDEANEALHCMFTDVKPELAAAKAAFDAVGPDKTQPAIAFVESAKKDASQISRLDAVKTALAALPPITSLIATLSPADFQLSAVEDCAGLGMGGREQKLQLVLTNRFPPTGSITDDVTVVCLARLAVSGGFAFGLSMPQRTFTALQTNVVPAPGSTAPPATAIVAEQTSSPIRVAPFAFAHYRITENEDYGAFFSFGIGTSANSGGAGNTVDYAVGPSFSLGRSVFITGGAFFGQMVDTQPGYNVGVPITPGADVKTITRQVVRFFIAISFGKS